MEMEMEMGMDIWVYVLQFVEEVYQEHVHAYTRMCIIFYLETAVPVEASHRLDMVTHKRLAPKGP